MADLSTDLSERLAPIVARSLAVATVDITSLTRLTGGASRETWQCVAFADGVEHRMILQRGRVAPGGANSASAGMEAEGEVLAAAEASGVPVAHVWARDGGVDRLGAPFLLTSFVAGETIARKIQRDEYFGVARENLVRDLGLAAAKLHSVPVDLFDFLTQVDPIEHYREVLDTLGFAHPAFELGFKYLAANKPPMVSTSSSENRVPSA